MTKRWISAAAAAMLSQIEAYAVAALAYLKGFEARVSSHDIIISDVFGADTFLPRNSSPEPGPNAPPDGQPARRWDDGLVFAPRSSNRFHDIPRLSAADYAVLAPFSEPETYDDGGRLGAAPHALVPQHRGEARLSAALRPRLPMLICAVLLLMVWINAGQSGPIKRPPQSAADSIAERFAGADKGSVKTGIDVPSPDARLLFAPRFAILYAQFAPEPGQLDSKIGPKDEDNADDLEPDDGEIPALARMQRASYVMIRNLPHGTSLSVGEQLLSKDWKLKSADLKSVVVRVLADRPGPIRATIEMYSETGASLGDMAVEIRELASKPAGGTAGQQKANRLAGGKSANQKRRTVSANAVQATSKPAGKVEIAKGPPGSPPGSSAKPQIFTQLPFLPGPYSAEPPAGNTVSQQILINLGVEPASLPAALTQSN